MRGRYTDAYSGLVEALKRAGYRQGRTLQLFPYDWRLDLSRAAERLAALVDRTLRETGADQVVLAGHSMGGLVARHYLVRSGSGKVRALIALATPWLGAPVVYRALAYGWDMGLKLPALGWPALPRDDVRILVQNFPSVYALAPGPEYFARYRDGYLARDGRALTYEECQEALAAHNAGLARRAAMAQSRLLDGRDHGAAHFLLVGKGRPTLTRVEENRGLLCHPCKTERFGEGDGVVPLHSADLGVAGGPAGMVDALGQVADVAHVEADHTFFAQSPVVHRVVTSWLAQIQGA